MKITYDALLARLWYDEEGGRFYCRKTGRLCGTVHKSRTGFYRRTCIDKRKYMDHVLAWFYMTGEWPTHQVDHRNRDSLDNTWDNLRESTHSFNNFNKAVYKNNRLGIRGVSQVKSGAYVAKIRKDNKTYHLGSFSTLKQAIRARRDAEIRLYGGCADDDHSRRSNSRQCESIKHPFDDDGATLPALHS